MTVKSAPPVLLTRSVLVSVAPAATSPNATFSGATAMLGVRPVPVTVMISGFWLSLSAFEYIVSVSSYSTPATGVKVAVIVVD